MGECGSTTGNGNRERMAMRINDWFLAINVGIASHFPYRLLGSLRPRGYKAGTGRKGDATYREIRGSLGDQFNDDQIGRNSGGSRLEWYQAKCTESSVRFLIQLSVICDEVPWCIGRKTILCGTTWPNGI